MIRSHLPGPGRAAGWRLSLLLAVALLVAAGAAPAIAATTWRFTAGAQSADKGLQAEVFLPSAATINVGDTVTWAVPTGEPHTITFLSGGERPPFTAPPTTRTTYDGIGLANSGLIANGATYTLTFTAAGTFPFVCLLHPAMTGVLQVNPAGTPYPNTQQFYDQQAQQTAQTLLATAQQVSNAALAAAQAAGPTNVTAGAGDGVVDVMRFLPGTLTVSVGQTVTWTNRAVGTPHTVTFGTPPSGDQQNPVGTDGPGHATISSTSQSVHSGFIGASFPAGATFNVLFTAPGTYRYICTLHADLGMVGTVVVTPTAATPTPVIPEFSPLWLFGSGLLALGLFGGLSGRVGRGRRRA